MSQEIEEKNKKAYRFQSVQPLTLDQLKEVFNKHLIIADPYIIDILVALLITHALKCDPVWCLFVAPSSGGKSEILNALLDLPNIFPISTITPKTFSSGYQGGKHALLNKLTNNEILMFKDFTSILSLPLNEQGEIMAQLREIYDGKFDKTDGTGNQVRWEGKLGFLAGVTEIIDVRKGNMNILGERFIQYRIQQPNRKEVVKKAITNTGNIKEVREDMRTALAGCVKNYLTGLNLQYDKSIENEYVDFLADYTNFATIARTEVIRDSKSHQREITFNPTPEMPTRFATSLWNLTKGLSILNLDPTYTKKIIKKICFDSIPKVRKLLLDYCSDPLCLDDDGRISNVELSNLSGYTITTIERNMEELAVLGVVRKTKQTKQANSPIMWHIQNEWRMLFGLDDVDSNINDLTAKLNDDDENANNDDQIEF